MPEGQNHDFYTRGGYRRGGRAAVDKRIGEDDPFLINVAFPMAALESSATRGN